MRDWNLSRCRCLRLFWGLFSAYLWGIETLYCLRAMYRPKRVFSIPMRDWNILWYSSETIILVRFQHTYEGLKPTNTRSAASANSGFQHTYEGLKREKALSCHLRSPLFSAYLWGIETISAPKWHEPFGRVFSIPMRDWNRWYRSSPPTWRARFQHTYEGLKLSAQERTAEFSFLGFQHTYEGLKLRYSAIHFKYFTRFQHTYEGLKHQYSFASSTAFLNV